MKTQHDLSHSFYTCSGRSRSMLLTVADLACRGGRVDDKADVVIIILGGNNGKTESLPNNKTYFRQSSMYYDK